jgi:hypothetical protein
MSFPSGTFVHYTITRCEIRGTIKSTHHQILLTDAIILADYLPASYNIRRDISLSSPLRKCDGRRGTHVGIFMEMPNTYSFVTELKSRTFDKIELNVTPADLGLLLTQS